MDIFDKRWGGGGGGGWPHLAFWSLSKLVHFQRHYLDTSVRIAAHNDHVDKI